MAKPKSASEQIPPEVAEILSRYDAANKRVHESAPDEVTDDDREELRAAHNAYRNLVTAYAEHDAYQRAHANVTITAAETDPKE